MVIYKKPNRITAAEAASSSLLGWRVLVICHFFLPKESNYQSRKDDCKHNSTGVFADFRTVNIEKRKDFS